MNCSHTNKATPEHWLPTLLSFKCISIKHFNLYSPPN